MFGFQSIVRSVEALWHTMLVQLVAQLRTDLQLPKCLQIVGYLRRMQAFGDNELRLKFLQARDAWLNSCLEAIPKSDGEFCWPCIVSEFFTNTSIFPSFSTTTLD